MNKMTYVDALTFVLTNCDLPTEVSDKLTALKEQTVKRNAVKSDKPTKVQVANASLVDIMLDNMTTTPHTVTEWQDLIPGLADYSNQKVSALMRKLVEDGRVNKTVDKRKSYFALAE